MIGCQKLSFWPIVIANNKIFDKSCNLIVIVTLFAVWPMMIWLCKYLPQPFPLPPFLHVSLLFFFIKEKTFEFAPQCFKVQKRIWWKLLALKYQKEAKHIVILPDSILKGRALSNFVFQLCYGFIETLSKQKKSCEGFFR